MEFVDILSSAEVARWAEDAGSMPSAVPTHLPSLNRSCRDEAGGIGIAFGWHVVIGGDTGHGKSLFALNLCRDAIAAGERVGFVSLEMSVRQLETRFYAMLTRTPVSRLEPGSGHSGEHVNRVIEYVDEQAKTHGRHPFFINTESFSEIGLILNLMDEWLGEDCRVFVVDYLQLCSAGDEGEMHQEIVKISSAIRQWGHQNKVITIGLSQYNYGASKNTSQPPGIHSLYGSARLSQDADLCLLLDHSRRDRLDAESKARTYLLLAKNRHGPQGEIPIEWDYRTLLTREAFPDEEGSWPGNK